MDDGDKAMRAMEDRERLARAVAWVPLGEDVPRQGVSAADERAVSVWLLGGLDALEAFLAVLPGPVLCPACNGVGTIRHQDGSGVPQADGDKAWFASCALCGGNQRVSDAARCEGARERATAVTGSKLTSDQHSALPRGVGDDAWQRAPSRGYGKPLQETLDDRVAERKRQALASISISGAFHWTDPRTLPVPWPWTRNE